MMRRGLAVAAILAVTPAMAHADTKNGKSVLARGNGTFVAIYSSAFDGPCAIRYELWFRRRPVNRKPGPWYVHSVTGALWAVQFAHIGNPWYGKRWQFFPRMTSGRGCPITPWRILEQWVPDLPGQH